MPLRLEVLLLPLAVPTNSVLLKVAVPALWAYAAVLTRRNQWPAAAVVVLGLSVLIAPPSLVLASGGAFLLSEFADFAVYTPLQRRGLVLAVLASSLAGLVVDSLVFLLLAFGSLEFLAGQVVGKAWAVLFSVPLIRLLRRVAPTPA